MCFCLKVEQVDLFNQQTLNFCTLTRYAHKSSSHNLVPRLAQGSWEPGTNSTPSLVSMLQKHVCGYSGLGPCRLPEALVWMAGHAPVPHATPSIRADGHHAGAHTILTQHPAGVDKGLHRQLFREHTLRKVENVSFILLIIPPKHPSKQDDDSSRLPQQKAATGGRLGWTSTPHGDSLAGTPRQGLCSQEGHVLFFLSTFKITGDSFKARSTIL